MAHHRCVDRVENAMTEQVRCPIFAIFATLLFQTDWWWAIEDSTHPTLKKAIPLVGESKRLAIENRKAHQFWLALAIVWVAGFSIWFHQFNLPNNKVPRWGIWFAVPYDLLDLIDPPVTPGAAPWSWLFLFERVPFAVIAIAIWLGAWGLGSLILRWFDIGLNHCERLFFSLCLGLSGVSLLVLLLGILGQLSRWPLATLLLVVFITEVRNYRVDCSKERTETGLPVPLKTRGQSISMLGWTVVVVASLFVMALLLGAMTPQIDFDVVEYHLGGPKEWFRQGQIVRLPHNVYTSFPFLSEMLVLAGMVLYGDWQWGALAGQAVIAGFAPLTGLGLYSAGRRWFSDSAGWLAALVYLTSPWTYRISIIAGAEGTLSCYLFAALFSALLVRDQYARGQSGTQSFAFSILVGAMAGSAMACKYTGLVSAVIPIGLLLAWVALTGRRSEQADESVKNQEVSPRDSLIPCLQAGRIRQILFVGIVYSIGVLASVGPWLLKNTIETGNPVYPLAGRIFGGIDRDEELDAKFRRGHANGYGGWKDSLGDLPTKVTDVVSKNDWHSPLMFCLAPLSVFWWRRRSGNQNAALATDIAKGGTGRVLAVSEQSDAADLSSKHFVLVVTWMYIVWQFATWWLLTHHIDRFYVPMFSSVAFLAGAGATWPGCRSKQLPGRPLIVWNGVVFVILASSILYNAEVMLLVGGFNAGRIKLTAARDIATAPRVRWLNSEYESGHLPTSTKILGVGEAQMFHARYPYLYNTVFNQSLFEQLCVVAGSKPRRLRTIDEIQDEFQKLGITHIDVNWSEILRYRATYGYTEFVRPETFLELQRMGLLGPALHLPSSVAFAKLGKDVEKQLQGWGESLITKVDGEPVYISGQVFPVIIRQEKN